MNPPLAFLERFLVSLLNRLRNADNMLSLVVFEELESGTSITQTSALCVVL